MPGSPNQRSFFELSDDELLEDYEWLNGERRLVTLTMRKHMQLQATVPYWLRSLGWYLFEVFDYPHPAWKMEMPGMTPWTTHHWSEAADAIHEAGAIQWRSGCVPDFIVERVWNDKMLAAQWKTQWVIGLEGALPLNYEKTTETTVAYLAAKQRWEMAHARLASGMEI